MPPERTSSGFGERLRDARERRGVSLREIANATKISVRVLEALERNDISRLPGGIFGRAFVRSYAVEVGLDPEATIQDFITQFPNDSVTVGHPTSDRQESVNAIDGDRRPAGAFLWLIAAGVVVAVVAGLLYFAMLGRRTTATPPSQAAALPAAETRGGAQPPSASAPAPAPVLPAEAAGPAAPASAADPAPADTRSAPAAPSGDQLTVGLTAKRPCWVSARVDGQKAIERLLQAGEQQTVTVRREMVLTAGDASAIAVQFNGADARALGKPGEVITAHFNLTNYKDYLQAR
jgi:cytoskeleton protein RodZ